MLAPNWLRGHQSSKVPLRKLRPWYTSFRVCNGKARIRSGRRGGLGLKSNKNTRTNLMHCFCNTVLRCVQRTSNYVTITWVKMSYFGRGKVAIEARKEWSPGAWLSG